MKKEARHGGAPCFRPDGTGRGGRWGRGGGGGRGKVSCIMV